MKRVRSTAARKVGHRIAIMACVATVTIAAAGCGSTNKPSNPQSPATTTSPSPATTAPPTTKSPQTGGAGF
jgi:hypothetical protein